MPTPPISPEEHARRLKAYHDAGGNVSEAARMVKLGRSSFSAWARQHGLTGTGYFPRPVPEQEQSLEPTRRETHDAAFWRRRYNEVAKELGAAEHLAEKLAGVRDVPYRIPDWTIPRDSKRGQSVIGCLVSDVHMGEKIEAEEINGINAFNEQICRERLRRYFSAVCTVGQRWASDTDCQGALLALAGDLISGDIHEELRMTNDLTAHEQVQAMVEECASGIRHLLETYGRVHVIGVPGNHGRTTIKPTAKLYARLSYDMLIVAMLEREYRDDPRVTFQAGAAKDQVAPIFGRTVLVTHGDKLGSKGGMGFAGPLLPIIRGTKKVEAQYASVGRRPDLILHGHYHLSANPGNIFSNGSVPGYSEYADDLRAVVEPPQQWTFLLHSRWWVRERMPIYLEDPRLPEKPRIRVPASWSE